ncbi:MAG: 50S ribosomal protein L10 [Candidatus Woykebacteria bacterium]
MAKTRTQKEESVEKLKTRFEDSNGVVITDYHGLSVSQMQELKRELKPIQGDFTVAKNTLVSRASKEAGKEIPSENLKGPTAILFSMADPIEAIKKLFEFIKKYELPIVKSAVFEGRQITKEEVINLSKIPGRDELYTKVVGSLNSPIYGIVSVLNGNLRNLVHVLSQVQKQKGGASN